MTVRFNIRPDDQIIIDGIKYRPLEYDRVNRCHIFERVDQPHIKTPFSDEQLNEIWSTNRVRYNKDHYTAAKERATIVADGVGFISELTGIEKAETLRRKFYVDEYYQLRARNPGLYPRTHPGLALAAEKLCSTVNALLEEREVELRNRKQKRTKSGKPRKIRVGQKKALWTCFEKVESSQ